MRRRLSISVVVATCDGERFVREQLRSIIHQERLPDEVVVADDASTDGTADLAAEILAEAPAVVATRLIRGDLRVGLAPNLERAVAEATGELVLFADQDDVWEYHKTRTLEGHFGARPTLLLAFTDASIINAHGDTEATATLWDRVGFTARRRHVFASDPLEVLLQRTVVTGATMGVRRGLLDVARPLPTDGWHDAWLALVAALDGPDRIAVVDEPLIRYRLHSENLAGVPRGRGFWSWYGSLRWPGRPVLRQWERAMELSTRPAWAREWEALSHPTGKVLGASLARLREAAEFHEGRRRLPASPARRIAAVLRQLPAYRRVPGGARALAWDLTSPLVMPDAANW